MSFEMSPEIADLAAAICQVQKDLPTVPKDSRAGGGKYSYNYADLPAIMDHVRDRLTAAGIAIMQSPGRLEERRLELHTVLIHSESGQWVRARHEILVKDPDPQGVGSAITYLRRYSLSAMLAIVTDEDDDATSATPRAQGNRTQPARPEPQRPQHTEGYAAECSKCGVQTTVPFKPTPGGKPILCRDCYRSGAPERQPSGASKGF